MGPLLYYSLLSLPFILALTILLQNQSRRLRNLPPGPPIVPFIGNLHYLKHPLHRTFTSLSHKYGDIMSLWFGSRLVVVVSSPSLVHECFNKNDLVLANRPRFLTGKYFYYNYTTIATSSYGDHWRNIRRIATMDVLSSQCLNSFLEIRTDEAKRLVQKLVHDTTTTETGKIVSLRSRLSEMTFNAMMRMILGKRYYGEDIDVEDVEEARHFREIIMTEMLSLTGANNKGDFLPLLRLFDFDGLEKRLNTIGKRCDAFLQGLIDEHRSGKRRSGHDSMIENLLKLQESQPEYYSDHMIKGLLQSMLLAGTNTSAVTMEWTMSELLNNPQVLKKAKDELDTQIGKEKLVEEKDLSKLPYLENIISETLRLHHPLPLLLPHYSSENCTIGGYNIPRDTIVLTNAFQINRDPKLWSDATSFKPERFENEGDISKSIAFGLGRRACPGMSLGQCTMGLTVGLLVQCFEWERESEEKLDMREARGITTPRLIPFQALCKARPIVNHIMKL